MHINLVIYLICLHLSHFVSSLPSITSRSFSLNRINRIGQYLTQSTNISVPRSSNTTHLSPTSSLLSNIRYKVKDTPIGLEIALRDPPIPIVYLEAFLTTVLQRIASQVRSQPNGLIPGDRYFFRQVALTNMGLAYAGGGWTWQVLSWTLKVSYSNYASPAA